MTETERDLSADMAAAAERALRLGFPVRIGEGRDLTPVTGAPYLISFDDFSVWFNGTPRGGELVERLARLLTDAANHLSVSCVMVGGSFLTAPAQARDLDCVIFYRSSVGVDVAALTALSRAASGNIDARFVPLDSDDDGLMVKLVGYFTLLYSVERGTQMPSRGPLLVRPPAP